MTQRQWKLMVAIFVIIASQAVLLVGLVMGGAAAGAVGMISIYGGLVGILVGILMGIFAIFAPEKTGTLAD